MSEIQDEIELLGELEERIGYKFKDVKLLKLALTHTSYSNEKLHQEGAKRMKVGLDNQRLEFLGDSVLGLAVSDYIYLKYAKADEGKLSIMRIDAVDEKALYDVAVRINLGKYLYLGKGENTQGGRDKPSVLSDALESLIAAIYLDSSFDEAKNFVLYKLSVAKLIDERAKKGLESKWDSKSMLQQKLMKPGRKIKYDLAGRDGPDNNPSFTSIVTVLDEQGNLIASGKGSGPSKKESEQQAAKAALASIKKSN